MHDMYPGDCAIYRLDRTSTAQALRDIEIYVDPKDWDGIPDESVLEFIAYLIDERGIDMHEIIKGMGR